MAIENKINVVVGVVFAAAVAGGLLLGRRDRASDPDLDPGSRPPPSTPGRPAAGGGPTETSPPETRGPQNPDIQAAAEAIQRQDWAAARDLLEKVASEDPEYPAALHNLGVLYERLGDPAAAREAFRTLAELVPSSPEAWVGLGWSHHLNGDHEEAERATLRALELDPANLNARYNLALYRTARGELEQAIDSYMRAMSAERQAGDRSFRGVLQALSDLQDYAHAHPQSAAAQFALALLFQSVAEPEWEVRALETFIRLAEPGPHLDKAKSLLVDARARASARAAAGGGTSPTPPPTP